MSGVDVLSGRERVLQSLLGGGTAYFALFVIVHVVLALTSNGADAWDVVALAMVVTPQWMLIRRSTLELSRGLSVGIAVLAFGASIAGLLSIATIARPDGYDACP